MNENIKIIKMTFDAMIKSLKEKHMKKSNRPSDEHRKSCERINFVGRFYFHLFSRLLQLLRFYFIIHVRPYHEPSSISHQLCVNLTISTSSFGSAEIEILIGFLTNAEHFVETAIKY